MSLVHSHELRLDVDVLVLNGTSYCVTQNHYPNVLFFLLYLGYQHTVLSTCCHLLESPHILHVLLVDDSVPEYNTHVVPLWLSESKDKGVVEVGPHVLRLDV